MATLTLTIPADKVARVLAAIEHTGFERLDEEGDLAYAKRYIIWQLKERDYVCRQDAAGSTITIDDELIGETA